MKNRNHSKARRLILIPIGVFVLTAICMVLAAILETPARGMGYSFFAFTGLLSLFLSPLPCLAVSVAGTVFAARAVREGSVQSRKYLIIGILEILTCAGGLFFAVMMFIAGQGV